MLMNKVKASMLAMGLVLTLGGCSVAESAGIDESRTTTLAVESTTDVATVAETPIEETIVVAASGSASSALDTTEMFTDRDLVQSPDLSDATRLTLTSGQDVSIVEEGIYVISGQVSDTTIIVEANEAAKVQLVLEDLQITNQEAPAIYVVSADKVFVTTTDSINALSVTGTYMVDGETNLDAVIFSKSDLVLNGLGTLEINAMTGNGISSKDDLKITGGSYKIEALADAIEANDAIRIYDGDINLISDKDGLHSENEEDLSLGYIYIRQGTITIEVGDDAIRGNSIVQIDGGSIDIVSSSEGIEATYVQINGGDISIYATDDGINAAEKSIYDVLIEVNGGSIDVVMASGDTDGFDANGDIVINGGTISVEGMSSFDADGTASLNGGEVTVNGEIITEIIQSQMGGTKGNRNNR